MFQPTVIAHISDDVRTVTIDAPPEMAAHRSEWKAEKIAEGLLMACYAAPTQVMGLASLRRSGSVLVVTTRTGDRYEVIVRREAS